jgi:GMP synthase-like glutamine amidotransferase
MKIHSLHHAPFEGLGCIEDWIKSKGFSLSSTNLYEIDILPKLSGFDMLIVMGGPMGVYDEDKFPWLKKEKNFIRKVIEEGKMVLGICLGSQLIAEALGANVYRNKFKEIGWFPISFTEEARKNFFFNSFPMEMTVFHWHGDTFDLPAGAIHIAESKGCTNQGFIFDDRVIALQFHLEVNSDSLKEMIAGSKDELIKDKYVQTPEEILNMTKHAIINNDFMLEILKRMEETYKQENAKRIKAF